MSETTTRTCLQNYRLTARSLDALKTFSKTSHGAQACTRSRFIHNHPAAFSESLLTAASNADKRPKPNPKGTLSNPLIKGELRSWFALSSLRHLHQPPSIARVNTATTTVVVGPSRGILDNTIDYSVLHLSRRLTHSER